jgi:hypothetical protein
MFWNVPLWRFHCEGDKPRTKNGWCVAHRDEHTNAEFGCNKRYPNQQFKWSMGVGSEL